MPHRKKGQLTHSHAIYGAKEWRYLSAYAGSCGNKTSQTVTQYCSCGLDRSSLHLLLVLFAVAFNSYQTRVNQIWTWAGMLKLWNHARVYLHSTKAFAPGIWIYCWICTVLTAHILLIIMVYKKQDVELNFCERCVRSGFNYWNVESQCHTSVVFPFLICPVFKAKQSRK